MTTNILAIFNTIEAMSVTANTLTPTVYDLAELRNVVQPSALPARLLLPYNDVNNLSSVITDFELGNTATVSWTITDRLLWATATGGAGIEEHTEDIARYIGAYNDAVLALEWAAIDDLVNVVSVSQRARADIQYPSGSGMFYIGVDSIWELTESDPI